MENRFNNNSKQMTANRQNMVNETQPSLEVFQDPFSANAIQQRAAMPLFAPFYEQQKGAN